MRLRSVLEKRWRGAELRCVRWENWCLVLWLRCIWEACRVYIGTLFIAAIFICLSVCCLFRPVEHAFKASFCRESKSLELLYCMLINTQSQRIGATLHSSLNLPAFLLRNAQRIRP
jgi:hypothetical protein